MAKHITLANLQSYDTKLKAKFNAQLADKLEGVKVNGTALAVADKMVDITITEGTDNGSIIVNGVKVEFHGAADLFTKVVTMIGDDANKSIRTIANEELVKQLIPENAKEALDTLAEIAAWIQQHPYDASAMNKAITALQAICAGFGGEGEPATVMSHVTTELVKKVDKKDGYDLSKNDFTDDLKAKLEAIEEATEEDIAAMFPAE